MVGSPGTAYAASKFCLQAEDGGAGADAAPGDLLAASQALELLRPNSLKE
jgi:hypothetical protein